MHALNQLNLLFKRWIIEDIINSHHLSHNSSITQGISYRCQPWSDVAQTGSEGLVSSGNDQRNSADVEDNSTGAYKIVEQGTGKFNQSVKMGGNCGCSKKWMVHALIYNI